RSFHYYLNGKTSIFHIGATFGSAPFILFICIKIGLIKICFILSSIQLIVVRLFYYGIIA
ncbi:hypothetical protein P7326_14590, partial [Staphylococcus aureus]|nr:hypothetical protein [Staphylococcus aureus]